MRKSVACQSGVKSRCSRIGTTRRTMAQRILNVRVRPFRVAVLLAKTASQDDVLLCLKFLSSLWGGRDCRLLAAEPGGEDPLTCFRLSRSRPDLVYGVGIDHVAWNERVREACQP